MPEELQCYNKGCQKKYTEEGNHADACVFHPGPVEFRDGHRHWHCCKKKSTDFGTWLSIPGCTRGLHSNVKPNDIERVKANQVIRPEKEDEVIVWNGLNPPAERVPEEQLVTVPLKIEITSQAEKAINEHLKTKEKDKSVELKIGAPCLNIGCEETYSGVDKKETCLYHPEQAIFHDGQKYYGCCKKKTTNFSDFMNQKGCVKGEHNWSKGETPSKWKESWFSSNGFVTINFYCKGVLFENAQVTSNGLNLRVFFKYAFGDNSVNLAYDLFGHIVPEESKVVIGERKMEIILKQRDAPGWPKLHYTV